MIMDTTCLYSTIKNTSGTRKKFGFLPPHGRELEANEELTIFGDIRVAITQLRGNERSCARRDILAFEAAMARGDIQIIHTPAPILADERSPHDPTASKMLTYNGSLGVTDPCWLNSASA